MNLVVTLYVALLFVVLTPGVLLTLPKGGSKLVVAATHGLVFALLYHFTHKAVWKFSMTLDGFQNAVPAMPNMPPAATADMANMKKDGFKMKH
jgi:hypothetical protein